MRIGIFALVLAAFGGLALQAQSIAPGDQFQPKVGESVILWHHAIKAGHAEEARAYFLKTLIPKLEADNNLRDNYFLVNERGDEILAISFWGKGEVSAQHETAVLEGMKAHSTQTRQMKDYKLIRINHEGLVPESGDKVVIFSHKAKAGKTEDVKTAQRDVIFPHVAKDEFTRNTYVLENAAGNELVSVIFLRGDFKQSPQLDAKLDKHLRPHLSEPAKRAEYTVFAINNE